MDRSKVSVTKVWKVNRDLVVADTIEEAIKLYKLAYPCEEVQNVEGWKFCNDNYAIAEKK